MVKKPGTAKIISIIKALFLILILISQDRLCALVFPDSILKIYQFPANGIPRIDGNPDDWSMVPETYVYGTDMLIDVEDGRNTAVDSADCAVKVTVGWVTGLNRLYFLYEAYDNYWDFADSGLHNDMLEISVDGDLSGGEFIYREPEVSGASRAYFRGSHAQNYHISTPAEGKSQAMVWNCPAWLNKLPYLNCAYSYSFKHGESGRLIMECWITPFDFISFDGPRFSTESELKENAVIGLSWLIADWDGPGKRHALPSLSHDVRQVHDASYLRPFRLMPPEYQSCGSLKAQYSFSIVDPTRRVVAFRDESAGAVLSWDWDFGDGTRSEEQHPIHTYDKPGEYIVILTVVGSGGISRYSTLWEVLLK